MSNDKALRRSCADLGVAVRWGLELMLELVQVGQLPAEDADEAAVRINRATPFMTATILAAFREKLAALG